MNPAGNANISRHLDLAAGQRPEAPAIKVPRGRTVSGEIDYLTLDFRQLCREALAWEAILRSRGIMPGDRALVMVRPGLPLIASVFGLFRLGAVPVVIDPGMGLRSFLSCVERTQPRALVGIPLAQIVSRLFRRKFRSVAVRASVPGGLDAQVGASAKQMNAGEPAFASPTDLAAILFTSGSTGAPKGVRYEHGMFEAQISMLKAQFGIEPGEVDLPLLPVFALFNPALGTTSVIPEVDPRKPAKADPARIVQAIIQEKVTYSFGSPTLWRLVAGHCRERGLTLPSLKRVFCAGAPVPADLWESARQFMPEGRMLSPYGATEALPISCVEGAEIAATTGGPGALVGKPLAGIEVRIVAETDGPIASLGEARAMPEGQIGEIIVSGPVVTREYDQLPEETARAKISGPDGAVFHRMGDCGCLDAKGRLWFCGRKAESIRTTSGILHTEPCERVFRAHPGARRCALIGWKEGAALVVESHAKGEAARALARELRRLGRADPLTASISIFFFLPHLPVDVRHNAKIHRLALARRARTGTIASLECNE